MQPKQNTMFAIGVIASSISGCATSVSEAEMQPLASAVQVSSDAIETLLQGRERREIAEVENRRFLAGQRVVALAAACEETDLNIVAKDCRLIQLGIDRGDSVTAADALRYMSIIEDYVIALNLLVSANTSNEISNAVGVLQSSMIDLSGAVESTGLARFAESLAATGDAPGQFVGFWAEATKRRAIRRLVTLADPEITTLADSIEQILNEELGIDIVNLYQAVLVAERRAIEARQGPVSAHRSAVVDLRMAHSTYLDSVNAPLPTAIRKLSATHTALTAKINGPAAPEETIDLLIELQGLVTAMNEIKEAF